MIGAHYDHLGRGTTGGSLADKEEAGQIHHGADDNASGTAAVLAIAESLAKQPRKRNLIVAFWSAEELGLIGSNAFVTTPPVPTTDMAAYLNFDMVGRSTDNKLTVQATGTSRDVAEDARAGQHRRRLRSDPPGGPVSADRRQQLQPGERGVLAFFTGAHVDYHKPSDTADKIELRGPRPHRHVREQHHAAGCWISTTRRSFTKVEQKTDSGGGRAGMRIFTGTIPDYATEVKGLLLGGVIGGGPAEQAGLQKGDVIVEIAGQSIANIYDYTYALELLKIGQPAKVIYTRNGERRETTLTPAARK